MFVKSCGQFAIETYRSGQSLDKLYISTTTVKSHLQNLYGKLNVRKRRDAVEKAMKIGIV